MIISIKFKLIKWLLIIGAFYFISFNSYHSYVLAQSSKIKDKNQSQTQQSSKKPPALDTCESSPCIVDQRNCSECFDIKKEILRINQVCKDNCSCGCDSQGQCNDCSKSSGNKDSDMTITQDSDTLVTEDIAVKDMLNASDYKVDILWILDNTTSMSRIEKTMKHIVDEMAERRRANYNVSLRYGIVTQGADTLVKTKLKSVNNKLKGVFGNEISTYSMGNITKTRALSHGILWYLNPNKYPEKFFRTSQSLLSDSKRIVAFLASDDSKKYPKPKWEFLAWVALAALIGFGVGMAYLGIAKATTAAVAKFALTATIVTGLGLWIESSEREKSFNNFKKHIYRNKHIHDKHPKAKDFLSFGAITASVMGQNEQTSQSLEDEVELNKYPNFEVWSFGAYLPSQSYGLLKSFPNEKSKSLNLNSAFNNGCSVSSGYSSISLKQSSPKVKYKLDEIRNFSISKSDSNGLWRYYFCYTKDPQIFDYLDDKIKSIQDKNNLNWSNETAEYSKAIADYCRPKNIQHKEFTMCTHKRFAQSDDLKKILSQKTYDDFVGYYADRIHQEINYINDQKKNPKFNQSSKNDADRLIARLTDVVNKHKNGDDKDLIDYINDQIGYFGSDNQFIDDDLTSDCNLEMQEAPLDEHGNIDDKFKNIIYTKTGSSCETKYSTLLSRANIKVSNNDQQIFEKIHSVDQNGHKTTPADPNRATIYQALKNIEKNKLEKEFKKEFGGQTEITQFQLEKFVLSQALSSITQTIDIKCGRLAMVEASNFQCVTRQNPHGAVTIYTPVAGCSRHRRAHQYQVMASRSAGISFSLCNSSNWNKLVDNALVSKQAVFFSQISSINLEQGRIKANDIKNLKKIILVQNDNAQYTVNKCLLSDKYMRLTSSQIVLPHAAISFEKMQNLGNSSCGRHYHDFLQKLPSTKTIKVHYLKQQ